MVDAVFTLDDLPGVTFVVTRGSGGLQGYSSNWIAVTGYQDNPDYDPEYDYDTDPNGYTADTDPLKRHEETLIVSRSGFQGP